MISFLFVEHSHAFRPSSLFSIYLTIGVLLDVAKSRSFFYRGGSLYAVGSLVTAAAALKGLILLLEELPKTRHLLEQRQCSTEVTSGFWTRALFLWLNKILFTGYRNIIDVEDLEPLGPEFSATYLSDRFATVWARSK